VLKEQGMQPHPLAFFKIWAILIRFERNWANLGKIWANMGKSD